MSDEVLETASLECRQALAYLKEGIDALPKEDEWLHYEYAPLDIELTAPSAERIWSTTEIAKQYGMAPTSFGKRVNHLKTVGRDKLGLSTAPNGKQVCRSGSGTRSGVTPSSILPQP